MPQDFSEPNLRGRSFRGQDLTGKDFSKADIREADFANAILIGANFSGAKAGLRLRWVIVLLVVSLILSILSGFISAPAGSIIGATLTSKDVIGVFTSVTVLITLAVFFIVTICQGLVTALGTGGVAGGVAGVVAVAVAGTGAAGAGVVALAGAAALAVAAAMAGVLAGAVAVTASVAVAGVVAGVVAVTALGAAAVVLAVNALGAAAGALAVAMTLDANALGAGSGAEAPAVNALGATAGVVAGAVAVAGTGLSAYVSCLALTGDEKHAFIQRIAIAFAATGGTSFRGADLTDANFTRATLKNTNFRGASVTRICWLQTKKLDFARVGTTYLRNAQVRQLLITGEGQNKNFDRLGLRGVNFQRANLTDASFIGADLSEANLQNADLSRAKLVQTQLDEADFTEATLTGACIEDWGITSHTKLHGVRCEYVFMRYVKPNDPDQNPRRKPDNWEETFKDGDFADFIKPIVDTLDLYHNQGVDPRAIAISFKQLAEKNPEAELEIVAMEKRGFHKFLLRAKIAPDADRSALSAEYFSTYNQLKALAEQEIRTLIAEKDIRIRSLENMVETALERPSFYSETRIEKVATMSNNPGGISQNVSGGQIYGGLQATQGDCNQQIMETYAAAPTEKQLTQQEVIQMLAQIEQLVGGAELPEATKEEVTTYLSAAKKAAGREEPNKELVKVNLKGIAETLENTSETVESTKILWENVKPILMQLSGVAWCS